MEENNLKSIKNIENGPNIISNISQNNPPLITKNTLEDIPLKNPINTIISKEKIDNLEKSISLLKQLSSKSQFVNAEEFKLIPDIFNKGKTFSLRVKNYFLPIKKTQSTVLTNKKNFYLTSYKLKKKKLKKWRSTLDLSNLRKDNMVDLIHDKEIDVCLDLIKSIPEKTRNKQIRLNSAKLYKNDKTNNLIQTIKFFNIDNINNQRIIENQILNNSTIISKPNSKINTLNNLSISMPIIYKKNSMLINNIYNKLNLSNNKRKKNLTSIITLKNNSLNNSNYNESNILNNNNSVNFLKSDKNEYDNDNAKSKTIKSSINNKINNNSKNKLLQKKYEKNMINFRTGFIRRQKDIHGDVFKFSKNNKNNENNNDNKPIIRNFKKKKEEKNKISLPEIEEYKSIIKDIESKKTKNQTLRISQKKLDLNKEENNLLLKDRFIIELNKMYLKQKNLFFNYFKDDRNNRKLFHELYKKKVNENIENINKVKRRPNIYVDGYSLLDGNINNRLNLYNKILGNKFYNKEQKNERISKLYKVSDEYENLVKNNDNEIFQENNFYKQLLLPKFSFKPEKEEELLDDKDDIKLKKYKYNNNNSSLDSSITFKIDNTKNVSLNTNGDDKVYSEYINFKKEYKTRYSFDS